MEKEKEKEECEEHIINLDNFLKLATKELKDIVGT